MRSGMCVLAAGLLTMSLWPAIVAADDGSRLVVDRVQLETTSSGDRRLCIALSALTRQGKHLDLTDPSGIEVRISDHRLDAPASIATYGSTDSQTTIVIVIQANADYAAVLPMIASTLDDIVLAALDQRVQIAILPYGGATGTGKLDSLAAGRKMLHELTPDEAAGPPALVDTIERALQLLWRTSSRKIVLVIGDGRDREDNHKRVTELGERADHEGVRIHSIGYSPSNARQPLRTLGELSKRSLGTFRWVQTDIRERWDEALQQLRDEILGQYVLTFAISDRPQISGKLLRVVVLRQTEVASNEVRVPDPSCGRDPCVEGACISGRCVISRGRGAFGWVLVVFASAIGLLVVLGTIGFLLQRRRPAGVSSAPSSPETVPALLMLTGPRSGERFALHDGFTIGQAPTSSLLLDDGYTSSSHAMILIDGAGSCRLLDRGSTNGTVIDGVRVTEIVLAHDMTLKIGATELRFVGRSSR